MKLSLKGLALGASLVLASQAHSISLPLEDYNLIVVDDYTHEGGAVWGTAFIGGDLIGNASEFATKVTDAEMDSLKVVGKVTASHVKVKTGNMVVKDKGNISADSSVEVQDHSSELVEDGNLSIASVASQLEAASTAYKGMATNASYNNGQFSSADTSIAVYNTNADDLFVSNLNFDFSGVQADNLIINVAGTTINADGFNMNPGSYAASNILWNFFEAETINVQRSMLGSFLAMGAFVDLNARVDGSIGAYSLTTSAQIHDYYFEQVNPVPLPGSLILLGSAIFGFGVFRKRLLKK